MTLTKAWANFVSDLGHKPELIVAGVQRIHANQTWSWPGELFFGDKVMTLKETGYTKSKITALSRHYTPQNLERAIADVLWRIKNKKYGSGVIYFQGEKKKNTKQDFCMTAMVVSYYPQLKKTRITVFYRTVELMKRFRGDLVYLTGTVFPQLKEVFDLAPVELVTFSAANATWHPMYAILLVEHVKDWDRHFDLIAKKNPRLWRAIAYWCWRYLLDDSKSIDSYSSARQVRVIAEKCTRPRELTIFKVWLTTRILADYKNFPDSVKQWRDKCVSTKTSKRPSKK